MNKEQCDICKFPWDTPGENVGRLVDVDDRNDEGEDGVGDNRDPGGGESDDNYDNDDPEDPEDPRIQRIQKIQKIQKITQNGPVNNEENKIVPKDSSSLMVHSWTWTGLQRETLDQTTLVTEDCNN